MKRSDPIMQAINIIHDEHRSLAAVLHGVWFFTYANSGGDLAPQDALAEFVCRPPD